MYFEGEASQSLASTPQPCIIHSMNYSEAGIGRIEVPQVALPARRTMAEYTDSQRRRVESTYDLAAGFPAGLAAAFAAGFGILTTVVLEFVWQSVGGVEA